MYYTINGSCVACTLRRGRGKKRIFDREERRRANKRYYSKPDKMAAQSQRGADLRRRHPERYRCYKSSRRAKVLASGGRFTDIDVREIGARQGWRCVGIDCHSDLTESYQIDHIIPVSRGGSSWPENIQLLCGPCNRAKGASTMDEWRTFAEAYR